MDKTLKQQGLSRKERKMEWLKALLAARRTSTKAGLAGLIPLVIVAIPQLPFYDWVNDMLLKACQSEQGPTVFLVGGALTLVVTWLGARFSKTPPNPGLL